MFSQKNNSQKCFFAQKAGSARKKTKQVPAKGRFILLKTSNSQQESLIFLEELFCLN